MTGKLVEVLIDAVELGTQLKGIEAADEDHIRLVGVVVVSTLVIGVQRVHRLVVANALHQVAVVGDLHLNVVAIVMFVIRMNYTPTKVGGFWEHEVVFRMLRLYSNYPTYRTSFFYHG